MGAWVHVWVVCAWAVCALVCVWGCTRLHVCTGACVCTGVYAQVRCEGVCVARVREWAVRGGVYECARQPSAGALAAGGRGSPAGGPGAHGSRSPRRPARAPTWLQAPCPLSEARRGGRGGGLARPSRLSCFWDPVTERRGVARPGAPWGAPRLGTLVPSPPGLPEEPRMWGHKLPASPPMQRVRARGRVPGRAGVLNGFQKPMGRAPQKWW